MDHTDRNHRVRRRPTNQQRRLRQQPQRLSPPSAMTSLARVLGMRSASSDEEEQEEMGQQMRATNGGAAAAASATLPSSSSLSRLAAPVAAPLLRANSNGAAGQSNGGARPVQQQQFAPNGQARSVQQAPPQQQQRRESTRPASRAGRTTVHSNGDEDSGESDHATRWRDRLRQAGSSAGMWMDARKPIAGVIVGCGSVHSMGTAHLSLLTFSSLSALDLRVLQPPAP